MDKNKKNDTKKRVTAGVAAAIATTGVVVGGLFQEPNDLLDDPIDAYMINIADNANDDLDGGDDGDESVAPEEKKRSIAARLRMRILAMPLAVRVIFVMPLWAVGWVIITLGSLLWGSILSPAVSSVLSWVCIALLLLGVLIVGVKTVFPNIPLKKIVNRHTCCTLIIGMLFVGALDVALQLIIPEKQLIARLVSLLSSTAVLFASAIPIFIKHREAQPELSEAESETDDEAEEDVTEEYIDPDLETRRLAEAIADTYLRK